MKIQLFDASGKRAGEVSIRRATNLLRAGCARRVLDERRREIGIRLRRLAPHRWSEISGDFMMNGRAVNRASGAA